ncbi:MAG: AAA family ATPase [Minwuiales bacterium]|nr:AAA family ATPase [Minwuiales bacterium]
MAISLAPGTVAEGERKQVTVLFADVQDSTGLIQALDPEEAAALLDGAIGAMTGAVRRFGGTINEIAGDGIMASFGVPTAQEDHAMRGCLAALAILEAAAAGIEGVDPRGSKVRVGLNSGEVFVRALQDDDPRNYDVAGAAVHLAARMESLARPGTAVLTRATWLQLLDKIEVEPLGKKPVRGFTEPVEVYRLIDVPAFRDRRYSAEQSGPSIFVGRQRELELLARTLNETASTGRRIAVTVGEPGIGKTSLLREFIGSRHARGWRVLRCRAASLGHTVSMQPIADLLRNLLAIEPGDGGPEVRDKISGGVGMVLLDDPKFLPAILMLLNLPTGDPEWEAQEPGQRRRIGLRFCVRLLEMFGRQRPLVVLVEDLHLLEPDTESFLTDLAWGAEGAGTLFLFSARPEYRRDWMQDEDCRMVWLGALAEEQAARLLDLLLGDAADLAPLKQLILRRTDGNPFFIEEVVRDLADRQTLIGKPGAYGLADGLVRLEVPPTVYAVLAARIDRLPAAQKRLLQTASAVGMDVPIGLLRLLGDRPEEDLGVAVDALVQGQYFNRCKPAGEGAYRFKHMLTRDVAYSGLLKSRRPAIHHRIVRAMERFYGDGLGDHVESLGHHAFQAALWDDAANYFSQSGVRAFKSSSNRDSANYFQRALDALAAKRADSAGRAEDDQDLRCRLIDLRLKLARSLVPLGEGAKIVSVLLDALVDAEALGDPGRLARIYSNLTYCHWVSGKYELGAEYGLKALPIADALDDLNLKLLTYFHLGIAYQGAGRLREAVDLHRRAIDILGPDLQHHQLGWSGYPAVVLRCFITWGLAELGAFEDAAACANRGMGLARELGHPYSLALMTVGLGHLHNRMGDFDSAIPVLEIGRRACLDAELPTAGLSVAEELGSAYVGAGRVPDAVALLEAAMAERAEAAVPAHTLTRLFLALGCAYLAAERLTDAARMAEKAYHASSSHGERCLQAWSLFLQGEIAEARGSSRTADADRCFAQAISIGEELSLRPLIARCYAKLSR